MTTRVTGSQAEQLPRVYVQNDTWLSKLSLTEPISGLVLIEGSVNPF